ncbi:MAG TPA: ubiquinone/menaquinone biosynthesis methyltransferase [Thermoplasmata archaeon]|nr:ubiquinone/menaquinone biosynthesis methyltransferase [Thermoplasmata archaeon]
MARPESPARSGPDGSPHPDPVDPSFERDVRRMFTHIAAGYQWFDHVASLGGDLLWRPRALWDLDRFRAPGRMERILDLGCGTGELTRLAARHFPGASVVGVDFTAAMLRVAVRLTPRAHRTRAVAYGRGTAQRLPFGDASFDLVTNAFLVRNLVDLPAAFGEMRRVLRPGGVLLSLEITEPPSPMFGSIFHAYFDHVVPWLGAAVDSAGPYRYLPESLRRLPPRVELVAALGRAGFSRVAAREQSMGIVTAFLAEAGRAAPSESH